MAIGRPIELTPNIATKNISTLATDSQTQFTVTGGYRINEIAVYRNGVRLAEGRDFTASDGDTVNLVTAAEVDDVIEFAVFDSFNISDAIVSAASTQTLNGDFNITGNLYAGTFRPDALVATAGTVSSILHVGTALTADAAGNLNTVGVVTASSFSGDGSGLTGVASTDNILTGTAATFTNTGVNAGVPNVNIVGLATVGIITAYGTAELSSTLTVGGAVNIDATTDSTSTSTGALIVDGGLGVAKNVYIGAGLSVAGTLTYEDVTSVDSVGLITAKSGVNITGGELTVGSGITMGIAGVATFSGTSDVHLKDNVKLLAGDGSDLSIWHNGTHSYIQESGSGALQLRGANLILDNADGSKRYIDCNDGTDVHIFYNNSKKWETTNDGTVVTGIATATVGIDAAISVWTLGADGSSHYTFTGPGNLSATNDPTLNLKRGQKYTFKNRSGGHPFRIQSTPNGSAGTAYNTGVTNNDGGDGTNIIFDVPYDAPAVLYYQCTSHGNMGGAMYISGSGYETKIGTGITIGSAGVTTFADGGASSNALKFGSGGDLIIYHDGSNSMIDNNTGNLNIQSDGTIYLTSAAGSEVYAQFSKDGAASLRYDNSTKLATTTSGVTITGTVAATNYTGDGSALTGVGGEFDITSCLFV